MAGFFKVTGITGGILYQADGVTQISNGSFITFAQGGAGLVFAPASNSVVPGAFTVQASNVASNAGLGGSTDLSTIQVNPMPLASGPVTLTSPEEANVVFASGGTPFIVSDPGNSGGVASVTVVATGGTLTLGSTSNITLDAGSGSGDVSVSFTGTMAALNTALDGLKFTPTPHTFRAASVSLTVNEGPNSASVSTAITIARVRAHAQHHQHCHERKY